MKMTISYKNMDDPRTKAIQDVKDYLGDRYQILLDALQGQPANAYAIICSFAGVRGYPVVALYEEVHGEGSFERDWKDI